MNPRLTILLSVLLLLCMPAAIALGACRTGDTVERGLERGHLVTLVDKAGDPSGCAILVPVRSDGTRRYDPTTGRFTATDPLEAPVGVPYANTYHYAYNRPGYYTDPSGENAQTAAVVVIAIIAVAGVVGCEITDCWGEGEGETAECTTQGLTRVCPNVSGGATSTETGGSSECKGRSDAMQVYLSSTESGCGDEEAKKQKEDEEKQAAQRAEENREYARELDNILGSHGSSDDDKKKRWIKRMQEIRAKVGPRRWANILRLLERRPQKRGRGN